MEDELEKLKPAGLPADMQSWNIEDLQNYIVRMEAEINHAKALIAGKDEISAAEVRHATPTGSPTPHAHTDGGGGEDIQRRRKSSPIGSRKSSREMAECSVAWAMPSSCIISTSSGWSGSVFLTRKSEVSYSTLPA